MPELLTIPLAQLSLSRFNARRQRPASHVTRLAQRMQRNGFEVSRALWVYAENGHYEVFAGGTRWAAAQEAELVEVPVLVYPADDPELISRLADEDNENDEYHVPVPLPDIWGEYRRLKDEEGWAGVKIAKAKQEGEGIVSERLQYALFPHSVLQEFFKNDFLNEGHARELLKTSKFEDLTPWLARDQSLCEIVETVLKDHRGGSAKIPPTATVFRKQVGIYNTLVKEAEHALENFPEPFATLSGTIHNPKASFLGSLAQKKVRTAKDVTLAAEQEYSACRALQRQLHEHHARQAHEAEAEQQRLEIEQARQAYRTRLLHCLQHGDCRTLLAHCAAPIHLVLTDPPYGMAFQSHRRVTTAKKAVIAGDDPAQALQLFRDMLACVKPKLATDAHLLVFTHQDSYCAFQQALTEHGFTVRRTMTWDKGTHGLGDTTRGEVLTQTEWIIHAVQGNPKFEDAVERPEILAFPGQQDSELPAEKPVPLLEHLIALACPPDALVVDPFAGSGHSLIAALKTGRQGWACEADADTYAIAAQRLYAYVEESLHAAS